MEGETRPVKRCPFRMPNSIMPDHCPGEDCALWNVGEEMCSLRLIEDRVDEIARPLLSIAIKLEYLARALSPEYAAIAQRLDDEEREAGVKQ